MYVRTGIEQRCLRPHRPIHHHRYYECTEPQEDRREPTGLCGTRDVVFGWAGPGAVEAPAAAEVCGAGVLEGVRYGSDEPYAPDPPRSDDWHYTEKNEDGTSVPPGTSYDADSLGDTTYVRVPECDVRGSGVESICFVYVYESELESEGVDVDVVDVAVVALAVLP
ncbi:hypothetical protein K439DRAFT_1621937 [Ramaria rubella]|nr:hypothetical protein K439DRAFT_1621937 [Ramaria rubella]